MNNMIALQARGANVRPARNRQAAMQGQNAMLQQQMNELQYTQALEGKARQDEIRNAMKANPNAGYGELSQIYRQHGDLAGALEMDKAAMDWRTGKSQLAKADAELFKNQLEIFGQVAPNIKDDASFQQAIGQMYEAGVIGEPRARQLLDMGYSPELVEQLQRGALSAKDRMAQDFDREKFDYTKNQDAKKLSIEERKLQKTSGKDNLDRNKFEFTLKKEHADDSKAFKAVSAATGKLVKALDKAPLSAPATLAAATSFMKLLDPGSVVRESELGAALAATGLTDRIMNLAKQTDYGRVMTTRQQTQFMEMARDFYAESERAQRQLDSEYTSLAQNYELSPENVIADYYLPSEAWPEKTGDAPPVEGAEMAPDGNWYVRTDEGYSRVD